MAIRAALFIAETFNHFAPRQLRYCPAAAQRHAKACKSAGKNPVIPFPFQSERRTDEDSALARLGGATTYPIEMEME